MKETVSLICTVRDEADNIAALLDSMLAQSRPPDEIVINDCGSRDATASIVQGYAARDRRIICVSGGHNISSGRNNAIAAASGPLIACTDAGLVLDRDWLAHLIAPLDEQRADLAGGFFRPAPRSLFELVLGATNYRHPDEIVPERFLPFGKSMAFRKTLWEALGGFPEWASHCEDVVFDLAAERAGYRRVFVPEAQLCFRPRSSLRAFARQYFFYARGDGVAGLWRLRHLVRYTTYFALFLLLLVGWRFPGVRWPVAALLGSGGVFYTRQPYRRLWPQIQTLTWDRRLLALALVPVIRLVGDCAKMAGYPVGVIQRLPMQQRQQQRQKP
ncbi:MAG: glycosyltransferase [Chloroflexaceae bacterium]|nr:glycosyltransferase [Chloroflexaceae bacterium]